MPVGLSEPAVRVRLGEVISGHDARVRALVCTTGVFDNQHGTALDLTGLITPGDVLANGGFRATGEVRMRNAEITRDLDFSGAQLHGSEGLDARGIKVGGCLTWKMDQSPEGLINQSAGEISRIDDTMPSWRPERYVLAGLCYRPTMNGVGEVTVDQRIDWLGKARHYAGTAYQELAQAYRLAGQAPPRRSPSRTCGTCANAATSGAGPGRGTGSWTPWGLLLMIYTWVMIIIGWVLATAVVAGITQMFRRR